jgi:hypothetical protein
MLSESGSSECDLGTSWSEAMNVLVQSANRIPALSTLTDLGSVTGKKFKRLALRFMAHFFLCVYKTVFAPHPN